MERHGHRLAARALVRNEGSLTGRDVTPEAVRPLFEKAIDGLETVWHLIGCESVGLATLRYCDVVSRLRERKAEGC